MDDKYAQGTTQSPDEHEQDDGVSDERRKAVAKLAYMSPVLAGLLFSSKAADAFSPPPPPGG